MNKTKQDTQVKKDCNTTMHWELFLQEGRIQETDYQTTGSLVCCVLQNRDTTQTVQHSTFVTAHIYRNNTTITISAQVTSRCSELLSLRLVYMFLSGKQFIASLLTTNYNTLRVFAGRQAHSEGQPASEM